VLASNAFYSSLIAKAQANAKHLQALTTTSPATCKSTNVPLITLLNIRTLSPLEVQVSIRFS
jgi:hypothetical protein